MALAPGRYNIISQNRNVGRMMGEPEDREPKPVFAGTDNPNPVWVVGGMPGGLFALATRNTLVIKLSGRVFALLRDPPQANDWEIHPAPGHPGLFTIRLPGTDLVWTATGPAPAEIRLEPITGGIDQAFGFVGIAD